MTDPTTTDEPLITCPKCGGDEPMRKLKLETWIVDRCEKCYGIWLDDGERIRILQEKKRITDVIDVGSIDKGREMDQITDIDCPKCAAYEQHLRGPGPGAGRTEHGP